MRLSFTGPVVVAAVLALAAPARAAADLEKLLPENTDVVVVVDTNKLLNAPVVKQYAPEFVAKYGYEGLLAATDGNPAAKKALKAKAADIKKLLNDRKEVEKLLTTAGDLVTRVTVAGSIADAQPGLLVIEGKWSKDYVEGFLTLMTLFAPEEAAIHVGPGRKVFEISGGPAGEKVFASVVADGVLVLTMDEDDMTGVLDRAAGKKKPAARAGIRQLVRDMDPDNAITIIADVAEEGIKVTGGVKVKSDIQVKLVIDAGTADKAKGLEQDLAGAIESIQDTLADMAANNPAMKVLADAVKRVKSSRTGSKITYELTLTNKEIDTLVKAALKGDD
jgi:hypothetical protein